MWWNRFLSNNSLHQALVDRLAESRIFQSAASRVHQMVSHVQQQGWTNLKDVIKAGRRDTQHPQDSAGLYPTDELGGKLQNMRTRVSEAKQHMMDDVRQDWQQFKDKMRIK